MHIQSKETLDTIVNAVGLSTAIVQHIAGDEMANTLGGSPLTRAAVDDLVSARIHAHFSKYLNQGVAQ